MRCPDDIILPEGLTTEYSGLKDLRAGIFTQSEDSSLSIGFSGWIGKLWTSYVQNGLALDL